MSFVHPLILLNRIFFSYVSFLSLYLSISLFSSYLRTGDLGFILKGQLFITSRIKDLIIIHGKNIAPQDVELAAEKAHTEVRPGCIAAFSVDPVCKQEQLSNPNLYITIGVLRYEYIVASNFLFFSLLFLLSASRKRFPTLLPAVAKKRRWYWLRNCV